MYKYVEREVEVLPQPALAQDVGDVAHQAELPLAVDLVQHGGHRHVAQAVAEQAKIRFFFIQNPIREKPLMSKKD